MRGRPRWRSAFASEHVARGAPCIDNCYTPPYDVYIDCAYKPESLMRDAAINLRARPEQRELIDQAAQLLGKNRSDFMLEAACDKAQSVLLDQVFFRLDAEKFRQFAKLLDAPPARNPGLERLMAVKAPWGKKSAKA